MKIIFEYNYPGIEDCVARISKRGLRGENYEARITKRGLRGVDPAVEDGIGTV